MLRSGFFKDIIFNEDDKSIVPIIPDFAKSLLGFIIGALTSVLVVKTTAANSFRTREARAKIFQIAKKGSDAVTRPNTYEGTHFYDLDGELMWANGADGSACGTEKWFFVTKKPGDKYENIGTCAGGMDKYRITLVA